MRFANRRTGSMKTSVIITVYNLEKYVAEAIDSVLQQTRKADEVLVVDDCSTDGTAAVVQRYGQQLQYLRMSQNSGGLSATFYGLRHAKGDVLFFLDGDDYWMKEKIESIMPLFENNPEMGIVSHDYIRINAIGKIREVVDDTQENIARILRTCHTPGEQSEAFKDSILGKKGYWGGSAYALRRAFVNVEEFEQWRVSFPFIRNTYLDLVLPTFILVHRPQTMVGYVHKKLFAYRQHGANTSGNTIPEVATAKKALRMGQCTTLATHGILQSAGGYDQYTAEQGLHILEYEYLTDIYGNKKIAALKKYRYLSKHHWAPAQRWKEAKRMAVALLFGPKMFLYLKQKLVS